MIRIKEFNRPKRFITRLIDLGGLRLIVLMRKKVDKLSLSYNRPVLFIRNPKSNSFLMDQIKKTQC